MRVGVIADIHSNLEALEAVLAAANDVEEIWCLGDTVGYGPNPNECVELVRDRAAICVAGNHDWAALGKISTVDFNQEAAAAAQWTSRQLGPKNREFLESLPLKVEKDSFTIVHGSPRDPIWEYVLYSSTAEINTHYFRTPYCLVGHSHLPVIFFCAQDAEPSSNRDPSHGTLESGDCRSLQPVPDEPIQLGTDRAIINPGSTGQPRDGIPEASFITIDTRLHRVTYHRVPYDIGLTQQKIQDAGLPRRLWMRLAYGM